MTPNQADHILLQSLIQNKTGKLTKLMKCKESMISEGFVGIGKLYLFSTHDLVFLHCGTQIRTSPIKHINKVIKDGFGTIVILETSTSTYEIFIDGKWNA